MNEHATCANPEHETDTAGSPPVLPTPDPREYFKLRYMGDCKCGDCHLVPLPVLLAWQMELNRLRKAASLPTPEVRQ